MGEEGYGLGPGELYINGEPFTDVLDATTEEGIPETFAEDGEPCLPKTLLHEASFSCELSEETAEAFKRLAEAGKKIAQVYAEAARALREWVENFRQAMAPAVEHFMETLREALENAAKKPPRVNKRPDYSQKAKVDTRGKIKRIRTQRSREPK